MLAVVHDEQQSLAGQRLCHGVDQRGVALWREPERRRDRCRSRRRIIDRRELDNPYAIGKLGRELGPQLEREPGLADPPGAAEGHQRAWRRTLSATSASRCSRPTNELSCCGRLPTNRSAARKTGNSVRRPSATTW